MYKSSLSAVIHGRACYNNRLLCFDMLFPLKHRRWTWIAKSGNLRTTFAVGVSSIEMPSSVFIRSIYFVPKSAERTNL